MDHNQIDRNSKGARIRSRFARKINASSRVREGWADRSDPGARSVNSSLRGAEFCRFARAVERDLNPRGPLERIVTRHAARAAWALQQGLEGADAARRGDWDESSAARTLKISITTLDLLQGRRPAARPMDEEGSSPDRDDLKAIFASDEWPSPAGFAGPDAADLDLDLARDIEDEGPIPEAPIWRGRLVFDFDISEASPVVRGTWITVSHVVSLIVDGATWADILRSHPELTEDDIRVCVAYAVAEDDSWL